MYNFEESDQFKKLTEDGKCLYYMLIKQHDYFRDKDKKYNKLVKYVKISIMLLSMISTIVLGLRTIIDDNTQIVVGLVISAVVTFITGVSSYFNFETYWMRNIAIHIRINICRDDFILETLSNRMNNERIEYYQAKLKDIQKSNIDYWERAINKV